MKNSTSTLLMIFTLETRPVIKFSGLLAGLLIIALLFSGCGLTKTYVQINYTHRAAAQTISGSGAVKVKVDVQDQRTIKDHIGRKGDEYSFLGLIIATNDVAEVITKAIETEVVQRGFRLGAGQLQIIVTLHKFFADYKKDVFTERIVGEVIMEVQVKKTDGSILFAKAITAEGSEMGGLLRNGNDSKHALEKALDRAISKLVDDSAFLQSLMITADAPPFEK